MRQRGRLTTCLSLRLLPGLSGFTVRNVKVCSKLKSCVILLVPSTKLQAESGLQVLLSALGAWVPDPSDPHPSRKEFKDGQKVWPAQCWPFQGLR